MGGHPNVTHHLRRRQLFQADPTFPLTSAPEDGSVCSPFFPDQRHVQETPVKKYLIHFKRLGMIKSCSKSRDLLTKY